MNSDKLHFNKDRCFVIAEIAQAHDGSLGTAHAYIEAVANAGADAIKFQTHIAAAESTPEEPWRVKFSYQDKTRYDYWKRMEFSLDQWKDLANHAESKGIYFLSTPFSLEAVDLLEAVGVPAWKVSSGDPSNLPLIERIAKTGKPIIFSSGMSPWKELDIAIQTARDEGAEVAILQCTTAYPTKPEKVGLNVIGELRERYKCPVGLSDHSGTIYAGLAAAALGADIIEVHVTFSHESFGPDVPASITTVELKQLVEGVKFVNSALKHPINKDTVAEEMHDLRMTFNKSIVASRSVDRGTLLTLDDLTVKKPGNGIPASKMREVIGKKLRKNVAKDQQLRESDFE